MNMSPTEDVASVLAYTESQVSYALAVQPSIFHHPFSRYCCLSLIKHTRRRAAGPRQSARVVHTCWRQASEPSEKENTNYFRAAGGN